MINSNLNKKNTITLNKLKVNERARVLYVGNISISLKKRLLEMGLTNGAIVKVIMVAPFGEPVCVELRGYELVLRKEVLKEIFVERIL